MLGLGPSELVVILLLVVLIFGATKISQLGRGLGEGISNFKRGLRVGNDASAEPPPPPPSGKSA